MANWIHKDRKCKYCDKPPKINYFGIKRRHKGYLRTCGDDVCLKAQYLDMAVGRKKAYVSKKIIGLCAHCGKEFIKEISLHKWCRECVPDRSSGAIMRRYNISYKEHQEMIEKVKGICPICNKRKVKAIDHDHKTGRVRGLLCNFCNVVLHLIEDKDSLAKAIKYLNS